jgi:MMP 1-O-methyltransferase
VLNPDDVTPIIDEVRNLTASVEGWLREGEGELLFSLAKACRGKGAIVEIGSWKGKSTIWLGKGSMAGSRVNVWAVDPHTGSEEHREALGRVNTFGDFKRNIARAGLDDLVTPIVKTSQEAAARFEGPVELLFIDGAHDYASAKADFDAWFSKVVDGGTVAFHDVLGFDGPMKVVLESVCTSRRFSGVHLVGCIVFAAKVAENSLGDRARNRLMSYLIGGSAPLRGALPRPLWAVGCKVFRSAGIIG